VLVMLSEGEEYSFLNRLKDPSLCSG